MVSKQSGKMLTDPEQLGKYLIQGILGEGGMGVVYKGYDPQLARDVAIKTIRRSLLAGKAGKELRDRFTREAQAEGRLIHPNIVGVYEYQDDDSEMPFFVMEYVEGKCLKDYLSRGMHFNLDMSLYIITQLLSALAYSHKQGVVHRDIKPANILLLEDDSIKIADFCIAKIGASDFTKTGQVMGTPQYASPEQALGLNTDARSDLYSTAVMLYELVSGDNPFSGKAISDYTRLGNSHFDSLEIGDSDQLRLFKSVILKALARDPVKRFQSADEFSAALQPLMDIKVPSKSVAENGTSTQSKILWLGGSTVLGGLLLVGAFYLSEPDRGEVQASLTSLDQVDTSDNRQKGLENTAASAAFSPEQRKKIQRLVKTGKLHLLVGRLISPEGSNAFHAFKLVLDLDPTNKSALSGMREIQGKVVTQSELLVARGDLEQAKNHLNQALRLFPGNQALQSLQLNLGRDL